jgi:hypothetical protein
MPPTCPAQVTREIVTLERMHRAFADGLMEVRAGSVVCSCSSGHDPYARQIAFSVVLLTSWASLQSVLTAKLAWLLVHEPIFLLPFLLAQYGMMRATKKKAEGPAA